MTVLKNDATLRFVWDAEAGGDGAGVEVHVAWNARRESRFAFSFPPDGVVHVEAPAGASIDNVRAVLGRHARWVRGRHLAAAQREDKWPPSQYVDGASLLFRGRTLTLRLRAEEAVHEAGGELLAPSIEPKRRVWAWYAMQAEAVLGAVVPRCASSLAWLQREPPWRHRFMKSRWGSCSSRGSISLNTHLVKLPDALMEHVVVHELCHLRHMNHGRAFYRLMDAALADWPARREALRQYHGLLLERPP